MGKFLGGPLGKFVALSMASTFCQITFAEDLDFTFFKNGSATDATLETQLINTFNISTDETKLLRSDEHLKVTTSFLIKKDETGKNVVAPYEGQEDTKYDSTALTFETKDRRFGAINLAFWLGKTVDKVKDMGFLATKKMEIDVYSHCADMANAYFDPKNNRICVGHLFDTLGRNALGGMASAAMDADVVVHELGHGIFQHLITMSRGHYFSFGNDMLGAMNEGQADFMAYTVTGATNFAPWMMNLVKEYYKKKKPRIYDLLKDEKYLRVINNTYNLSRDSFGEIHDDGRIFAGVLFDLAQALGNDEALKLWLTATSKIHEASSFYDHGLFVKQADQELNGGKNADAIDQVFTDRGIFGNKDLVKEDITVQVKVLDNPLYVNFILKEQLRVNPEFVDQLVAKLNSNGTLDKGECAPVELTFKNQSDHDLVGLEFFVPTHLLPEGLSSEGQNRNYLGLVKQGESMPKKLNVMNLSRPWILLCANKNNYDVDKTFPVVVKSSAEGFVKLDLSLKKADE